MFSTLLYNCHHFSFICPLQLHSFRINLAFCQTVLSECMCSREGHIWGLHHATLNLYSKAMISHANIYFISLKTEMNLPVNPHCIPSLKCSTQLSSLGFVKNVLNRLQRTCILMFGLYLSNTEIS